MPDPVATKTEPKQKEKKERDVVSRKKQRPGFDLSQMEYKEDRKEEALPEEAKSLDDGEAPKEKSGGEIPAATGGTAAGAESAASEAIAAAGKGPEEKTKTSGIEGLTSDEEPMSGGESDESADKEALFRDATGLEEVVVAKPSFTFKKNHYKSVYKTLNNYKTKFKNDGTTHKELLESLDNIIELVNSYNYNTSANENTPKNEKSGVQLISKRARQERHILMQPTQVKLENLRLEVTEGKGNPLEVMHKMGINIGITVLNKHPRPNIENDRGIYGLRFEYGSVYMLCTILFRRATARSKHI